MPNPATLARGANQADARIPDLGTLPPGFPRHLLSVPVYNPEDDTTYQATVDAGDGSVSANAVVGGHKQVQYRSSLFYQVPDDATTLDRLLPATIVPGTLATVDNPSDTPFATTLPARQYVATRTSSGTAGAVEVPAYIGAAASDTVFIVWVEVVTGGNGAGVTPTQLAAVATTLLATAERTAAYTLALADAGCQVPVNVAGAVAVTIPAEADVAFPVGTILEVAQEGAGQLTVAGAAGVTVQAPGGAVKTGGQYAVVGLRKKAANVWRIQGGVS